MIPKEIDELMWTIAESNDPMAIDEFGNRYPNLREEMLKRMRTIKALKSGSRLPRTPTVPTFQNTEIRTPNWKGFAIPIAAVFLVLSAFGIWKSMPKPEKPVPVPVINLEPPKPVEDPIKYYPPANKTPETISGQPQPGGQYPNPPNISGNANPKPNGLKSLKIESAPLQIAIQLIASEGLLDVTIAPGMPNPIIKVDYANMTPMDMLKDLGDQYAFSTVLDGNRAIIVIPKKDEDEGQISESR